MAALSKFKKPLFIALVAIVAVIVGYLFSTQYEAIRHYHLLQSIAADNAEAVSDALKRGIDVNRRFGGDGETALHRAAVLKRPDIAALLLQHGADPNITDAQNVAPLLMASYRGRLETVRLLLSAGARVNEVESRFHMTPLIQAARKGHFDIVRLLLDNGADAAARTVDGKTALDKARDENHQDVVNLLSSKNYLGRDPVLHTEGTINAPPAAGEHNPLRTPTGGMYGR